MTPNNQSIFEQPRYKKNPMDLFFEYYILDVLGFLTKEKDSFLNSLELYKTFNTKPTSWQELVKHVLKLPQSIDNVIRDEWNRKCKIAKELGAENDPRQFSIFFVNDYYAA